MKYDVAIIGAGPAGLTAAIDLALRGVRVALIGPVDTAVDDVSAEWLPTAAVTMLEALEVEAESSGEPFDQAVFHSADLSKSASWHSPEHVAQRVSYQALTDRLRQRVKALGIPLVAGHVNPEVNEDRIVVPLPDRQIEARLMLRADGAAVASDPHESALVAAVTCAIRPSQFDQAMHWMVGLDPPRALAAWWSVGDELVIRMHLRASPEAAVETIRPWIGRILSAMDLSPDAMKGEPAVRPEPYHRALDIESHVGKRCIAIGDAGGFVATLSRQGLYPGIWSARLAAGVVAGALDSAGPQDAMRRFDTLWRSEMADYLRPPNTDARFLVPLVFSNEQMAAKMADAFWTGSNI